MIMKAIILIFLIVIYSGIFAQNNALILNGGAKVNISNGAVLSINQPNTAGILVTGSGTSYIQSEGETNRVAWHINSSTGSYVIPFGVGSSDTKIDMTYNINTAGSATGTLVASTYATPNDNSTYPSNYTPAVTNMNLYGSGSTDYSLYAVDRFWVLRKENWSTNPSSSLTLTYPEDELAPSNTITESSLLAQYWDNTLWNPTWASNTALLGANDATNNQVNSINSGNGNFYTWTLSSKSILLPIDLISMNTHCDCNMNSEIDWKTASETNNDYFTVYKSYDAVSFFEIGRIQAAGNSNVMNSYQFTDSIKSDKITYYQIKQTDYNGQSSISKLMTSKCNLTESEIALYPNPCNGRNIIISTDQNIGNISLEIFNNVGQLVALHKSLSLLQENPIQIQLDLTNGIYYFNISTYNSVIKHEKVVIINSLY